jgi:hypothetical protein
MEIPPTPPVEVRIAQTPPPGPNTTMLQNGVQVVAPSRINPPTPQNLATEPLMSNQCPPGSQGQPSKVALGMETSDRFPFGCTPTRLEENES